MAPASPILADDDVGDKSKGRGDRGRQARTLLIIAIWMFISISLIM